MATMPEEKPMERPAMALAADYEYNTLMRLLGVSVSKHLLDEHFTVIWANDFYYQLIGWPREEYEATFHNHCDLYYRNDQAEWKRLTDMVTDSLMNGRSGYNLVTPLRRRNGEYIWVKFSAAFSDEYVDGYQVAYTVMTNIDDLVRMQKEQSVTYDNIPGFVAKFCLRGDGLHLLDANDRFRAFFGCEGQCGPACGLSNLDTVQNRTTYVQNLPLMREGKHVHFTLQAVDHSGGNVWLQVNGDCIDHIGGDPVYLVIYIDITDITEQRELQRQLEERSRLLHEALEAAKKANRAKSDFLSRMSHDIRTPMNAVMGMSAIAASHIDDKERVLDCLAKIDVSAKLLLSLINEVLDMSKIESGRITMAQEEFALGDVIQNIVTITQPSILEKGHSFDIHDYGIRHERVVGDPNRLEQVFLNVLSNSIKYTPDRGSIVLEMRETPCQREGYGRYEFIFRDNGYGMTPQFLEKLFTPFERADDETVHTIQGTGLGMAISQNIVRMMGGEIEVESAYGKGSAFTVSVCLQLQGEESEDFEMPDSRPVLVVDDDRIACETTCERLDEMGLDGRWVLSGGEAVKRVSEAHRAGEDFFAILIDMKMPGMDGIETARQIRAEVGAGVPIILLSAYDWTDYEAEARAAGINGFVGKPMLKSNLVYAFKRYVLGEAAPAAVTPAEPARSYAGKRLLLVEDNDLNREIATEILSGTGAAVETAANGLEAVERFSASSEGYYDLVFMDLQMPIMGGIEASVRIRGLQRKDAKAVPIVAMTANVFAEDVEQSKAAGMNDHLPKPLDLGQIARVLEQYIG